MLRPLGTHDGFLRFVCTAVTDLDFPALLALLQEAWQADYLDQVRPDFNEAFLRRLMAEQEWVGILVCTPAGQPVGFELALPRTLYCRQQPLRAYYATVFTVSSHYRRRGIGQWLLEGINQVVFAERQADLIFSTFHQGHAGSLTVQATFDRLADWGVYRFHSTPIWSRRLDQQPFPPLTVPLRAVPIVLPATSTALLPHPAATASAGIALPSVAAFTEVLRTHYDVAFGLDGSFRTQYLQPDATDAGTFWYDMDQGASCCASFYITPLMVNERRLHPIGQLHSIHTQHCTPLHLERMLHHLGLYFSERGCFAITLYDQGAIPPDLLHRLGFRPSEDRYLFAVRGPRHAIDAFTTVHPPFFMDFT